MRYKTLLISFFPLALAVSSQPNFIEDSNFKSLLNVQPKVLERIWGSFAFSLSDADLKASKYIERVHRKDLARILRKWNFSGYTIEAARRDELSHAFSVINDLFMGDELNDEEWRKIFNPKPFKPAVLLLSLKAFAAFPFRRLPLIQNFEMFMTDARRVVEHIIGQKSWGKQLYLYGVLALNLKKVRLFDEFSQNEDVFLDEIEVKIANSLAEAPIPLQTVILAHTLKNLPAEIASFRAGYLQKNVSVEVVENNWKYYLWGLAIVSTENVNDISPLSLDYFMKEQKYLMVDFVNVIQNIHQETLLISDEFWMSLLEDQRVCPHLHPSILPILPPSAITPSCFAQIPNINSIDISKVIPKLSTDIFSQFTQPLGGRNAKAIRLEQANLYNVEGCAYLEIRDMDVKVGESLSFDCFIKYYIAHRSLELWMIVYSEIIHVYYENGPNTPPMNE